MKTDIGYCLVSSSLYAQSYKSAGTVWFGKAHTPLDLIQKLQASRNYKPYMRETVSEVLDERDRIQSLLRINTTIISVNGVNSHAYDKDIISKQLKIVKLCYSFEEVDESSLEEIIEKQKQIHKINNLISKRITPKQINKIKEIFSK